MRQRLRFLAGLTALLLLLTSCIQPGVTIPKPQQLPHEISSPEELLAYVPLDDRPVNTDRVFYLAASLGYTLRMPEEDLYRTRLDQQPRNTNGTAFGNRAALYEWILAQENDGCDRYVLSMDQLMSGGLVNSRHMSESLPISLSDGTSLTEEALLEKLILTLAADEKNTVWLLDTVMRLAPTVGYDGWDLNGYEALRAYGMVSRPTLVAAQLTPETIVDNYGLDATGTPINYTDFGLSPAQIQQYHNSRSRKLSLIAHALALSEDLPNIQFIIGVDDSAPSASIQTNELAFLRQASENQGTVLSGADEIGMMAVCRLYASEGNESPQIRVRYFGGSEQNASSDYDHQPMTEIVSQHLAFLGAQIAEEDADLELLVLTAPADKSQANTYINSIISVLQQNAEKGTPTILMDAAKNQYDSAFQDKLIKKTDLGFLLGYAGFYDLANVTGIAVSNGLARWLCLQRGGPATQSQQDHFIRTLTDSLLKDLCYKNKVKPKISLYVRNTLQGDPDNFCLTGTDHNTVLAKAEEYLEKETQAILKNLSHSSMLVSSDGTTAGLGTLSISGLSFPWLRVFEIRMDITIDS